MKSIKIITATLLLFSMAFSLFACRVLESDLSPSETLVTQKEETTKADETTKSPDTLPPLVTEENRVTISMVGDVLLHEKVTESGIMPDGSYSYDHLFANVKEEIESSDIAIVNQEVILGGSDIGLSGYPSFNGPFEVGDAISNAGFDIVLHATNHTIDRGSRAVRNCIEFWDTKHPEMAVLGINSSEAEQSEIYVREEKGIKIAFLNYTYGTNGIPLPSDMPYCVDLLDESTLRRDIEKAEKIADFTVVLPHWGTEYILEPDSNQKYWAQIMFDCGADLVIGTHPHVIQPIELWDDGNHKMLVYYSVGNFINSTAQKGTGIANRMVGGMASVTLEMGDSGEVFIKSYSVLPLVTHVLTGPGQITTYRLCDYTEELAKENEICSSDPAFSLEYCEDLVEKVWDFIPE